MNEQPPSTCIYICHVFTWYPGDPERALDYLGLVLQLLAIIWVLEIECEASGKPVRPLNH